MSIIKLKEKIHQNTIKIKHVIHGLLEKSKKITLPGFQGASIYNVSVIFIHGFTKGFLTDRAAAVSFNFLTALFPLLLFAFTLIPYIPYPNFQTDLLLMLQDFIPKEIWEFLSPTITYIVLKKQGSLLSVGVIMALYFGSNGINSLLNAFTQSKDNLTKYSWLRMRLNSILVLFIIGFFLLLSISMASGGSILINFLNDSKLHTSSILIVGVGFLKWLMTVFFLLAAVSFLYRLAVKGKKPFPFFSVGATITTILMIATTWGFEIYIANFTRYNALYGSLGTLLILTMYLYLNSMFLLIGFEINVSIYTAKMMKKNNVKLKNR